MSHMASEKGAVVTQPRSAIVQSRRGDRLPQVSDERIVLLAGATGRPAHLLVEQDEFDAAVLPHLGFGRGIDDFPVR